MSTPKECGLLGRCFYAECHCKPAPVSATEPECNAIVKEFTTSNVRKEFGGTSAISYAHSIKIDVAAMASTIHTLRARLAEAERALRGIDAACLKVCVDSTGTADDFGKESADWRYLLIGEGDAEIIATDDPASVIESLGQMLGARDFALGQQWVTKMTTADVDSPSVLGAGLLAELERVTMEQVERACVAFYGERGWNTAPVRMKADACEWMRAALTAARGGG